MKENASILVLDTNPQRAKQMVAILERQGYAVRTAATGPEALSLAQNGALSLVIAHAQLQKGEALAIARRFKETSDLRRVPFFLILPRAEFSSKVESLIHQYVDETFVQPIQVGSFLGKIKDAIDNPALYDRPQPPPEPAAPPPAAPVNVSDSPTEKLPRPAADDDWLPDPEPEDAWGDESTRMLKEITDVAKAYPEPIAPELPRLPSGMPSTAPPLRPLEPPEGAAQAPAPSYLAFYGFRIKPFSNTPDERFFYSSYQHSQALLRLTYCVENMEGLGVLTGHIGAGKTTLARRLLATLDPDEYEAALMVVIHSSVTSDWLLNRISVELGVEDPPKDKLQLIGKLYQRLVEIFKMGKKSVILIDEAQMLESREVMEELRGLLNLEVPGRKLLTFILFGLGSLEQSLALDEPLRNRVAIRYSLSALDRSTMEDYIEYRSRVAGVSEPLFEKEALDLIFQYSRGVPRLVNTICNNCLLEGYLQKKRKIPGSLVVSVCNNLHLDTKNPPADVD